ncbi:MAG: ABC transporter permease subunit [Planctomycetota bacterium]|nr:ABC transporter permease subunit [Planctomycetota bacterium]MCX8040041.1 ABC transporter permease subunit [Planctomycetota bacterium]MDW8373835.1 ABC transporter permease subunit [Planctomycetota bacterium]
MRRFGVARPISGRAAALLWACSFLLPLALWSAVSYIPWLWHPLVKITDAGDSTLSVGMRVQPEVFAAAVANARQQGGQPPQGEPANPIFLPAPHEVLIALWTGFTSPPLRSGDPWLYQSLWHSITIIFWGFVLSVVVGVPLGILCGAIPACSLLVEPFIDFVRYMPAPAFGALCVAIFGINDAPKIAIIFIGTFFQMVLVIAHTTRQFDRALIEAAQTLGADDRRLLTRVIVPGILPSLYTDLRVLLGWAWTYLIVAELIGVSSGISWYINQQGKYRAYDQVFAGIITIGLVGLITDQALLRLGRLLFPWTRR